MSDDVKVHITKYENYLIIKTIKPEKDENFIPAGGNKIGCVLIDTKKHLGMSDEAFNLMKEIKKSGDDIGDFDTWETDKGQCVGWLGGTHRLVDVSKCESSNKGIIDIEYISIPNNVPPEALEAIIKSD